MSSLPRPRGPLSERLFAALCKPPHALDPLSGAIDYEDLQLALYVLYELHYRGFAGVDDRWEWEPSLLRERARLERAFMRDLKIATNGMRPVEPNAVAGRLRDLAASDGPSLSKWCERHATLEQMREFAIHRSLYQLKEADPHSFAIPRVSGAAKAALLKIQYDEYGAGCAAEVHATLFGDTMRAL